MLNVLEVAPKADTNTIFIPEGTFAWKQLRAKNTKEVKLFYMLGALDKEKLTDLLPMEELEKLIIRKEDDVLYGNVILLNNSDNPKRKRFRPAK